MKFIVRLMKKNPAAYEAYSWARSLYYTGNRQLKSDYIESRGKEDYYMNPEHSRRYGYNNALQFAGEVILRDMIIQFRREHKKEYSK